MHVYGAFHLTYLQAWSPGRWEHMSLLYTVAHSTGLVWVLHTQLQGLVQMFNVE
jgi:hypothetical protein